ncbi:MAG: glucuronate isomerase [Acutalibacteraceae bacterium]|nr:glucuronate isomerase [Acutalibacteraceae bacterium]
MSGFMTEDFLLYNDTAKKLYHEYSKALPIIDYHCHVSPKEIYEDKRFENITELWLSGDHYKWRLMRSNGVSEDYITGNKPAKEKFLKFAELLPKAIGNPMYHWCHFELKRYFGYEGVLSATTAEEVWSLTEEKLRTEGMSVREIIEKSNVAFIGTTDDPIDSLEYHQKIKEEGKLRAVVAPSFRPDKAFNLNMAGYADYIATLSEVAGVEITSVATLKKALRNRMEHFNNCGCKASDHGINFPVYEIMSEAELDSVLNKALSAEKVSDKELFALQTEMLLFCAEEYYNLGWAMQIHYNCLRNPNTKMFRKLGPDTGFDIIGPHNGSVALTKLLDRMYLSEKMPKIILYSLDSGDNSFIDTLLGAFQQEGYPGTIQHGSAWWFNDTMNGMREQMKSLASLGLLGNFVGMLTDSRSFLSYTRHEYFRRILCGMLGEWVEKGEYPDDIEALGKIAQDISYGNAKRFFGLEEII